MYIGFQVQYLLFFVRF